MSRIFHLHRSLVYMFAIGIPNQSLLGFNVIDQESNENYYIGG